VGLRLWFVKRLSKHFEEEKEQIEASQRNNRSR